MIIDEITGGTKGILCQALFLLYDNCRFRDLPVRRSVFTTM